MSFYLLFSPPDDLTNLQGFIWLTVFAVLVRVSYTFYNIPHLSLGAEMVSDYEDRSKLFAYQAFISAMSVAVSYGLITAYYFPTTVRTSGVEVLKGPASIEHGPYTIGGAINLLSTPVPESASGFFNQELGTDGASRTHVHYGTSQENYGFLLEGHIWNSDGFDSLPDGGDTGFEKNDYIAKFRLNSDPSADIYHELNVKYQWSDELSNQTYVGLADADFRKNPHSRYGLTAYDNMDNEHDGISFNYILDTGNLEFSALIYKNEFQRDWFKVDKIDNKKVYGIGNGINNIIGAANSGIATASAILNGNNSEAVEIKLKHNNRSYSSDGVNLRMEWGTDRQLLSVGYRNTEDDEDRFQWYETANWYTGKLSALTAGDKPGYSSNNRVTYSEASAFFINEEIFSPIIIGDVLFILEITNNKLVDISPVKFFGGGSNII